MKNKLSILIVAACLLLSTSAIGKTFSWPMYLPAIMSAGSPSKPPVDPNIPTVTSSGQVWMDRNLGASRVATSLTDSAAYGDLYQWGRLTDGHQRRTSPTTSTVSTTDVPGHGSFIAPVSFSPPTYSTFDWRSPQNDNLWQEIPGINNPCPSGFRIPTHEEWRTEIFSWSSPDAAGAFASPLKLVLAGIRNTNGLLMDEGMFGNYWSSTASSEYGNSYSITFSIQYKDGFYVDRAYGISVRCIKN